jgi:hypothetical protein
VRGGAGRSDRLFRMAERVIGEALSPKDEAQQSVATRPGVGGIERSFGAVALGIVQREAFLEMPAGGSNVA